MSTVKMPGDCTVNTYCKMAATPKQKAVLRHVLH